MFGTQSSLFQIEGGIGQCGININPIVHRWPDSGISTEFSACLSPHLHTYFLSIVGECMHPGVWKTVKPVPSSDHAGPLGGLSRGCLYVRFPRDLQEQLDSPFPLKVSLSHSWSGRSCVALGEQQRMKRVLFLLPLSQRWNWRSPNGTGRESEQKGQTQCMTPGHAVL